MPSIITDGHAQRIAGLVEDAKSRGENVIAYGGEANGTRRPPFYFIVNPSDDCKVMQQEIFGPVLPIKTFKKVEDAIVYTQTHDRPLGIGLFTDDKELAERLHMPLDKVKKVLKIAKEPISLETPVGDEEDSSLGDFIEDKNALIPIDAAVKSSLRDTTTRILSSLTPREERVLRMRFGIGMNSDHTLEEVGQQFSVTRERIRQIEAKALRKLKHPSRSKQLKSFLES